ncbi:hypothetical protein GOV14_03690 [Candidatus Pacearchaeota archaeon]|nr:hypothetical protein [Candidatus Pacearchaeota archaeon]
MDIDLKKLAKFLVQAKISTYASMNKMKIDSERPRHDELEFFDEEFYYRDSYVGFFQAPGMEEVRLGRDGKTIWTMAYSGGMLLEYQEDVEFAMQTFTFLKKAMSLVNEKMPYRGIDKLKDGDWEYVCEVKGDIKRFIGHERIFFKNKEVFSQDYIGGLVLDK